MLEPECTWLRSLTRNSVSVGRDLLGCVVLYVAGLLMSQRLRSHSLRHSAVAWTLEYKENGTKRE
jgi:hypothetical protein